MRLTIKGGLQSRAANNRVNTVITSPFTSRKASFGEHITGHNSSADRGRELVTPSKDAESPNTYVSQKIPVFGHNLPTTNARWPAKGSKDAICD